VLVKFQSMILGTPLAGTATSSRLSNGTQNDVSFISSGQNTSSWSKSSRETMCFVLSTPRDWTLRGSFREAASATAHPSRLNPVLLYNGLVQGSKASGLPAIARIISSLVQILVPFDRSELPGSQNAGALISTSSSRCNPGSRRTSFVRTRRRQPSFRKGLKVLSLPSPER